MNQKGEEDLSDNNPLALSEANPWQQYFADTEIRKVIRQDVERTFPDVDFFRSSKVQQCLTDILFIYCKLNRDISYRQGMHELLAPIYWVIATECLDTIEMDQNILEPTDKIIAQTLDSAYIEHDAFILFEKVMKYGKSWYEFNNERAPERPSQNKSKIDILPDNIPKLNETARLNPVVVICHRIHHQYLHTVDPLLYKHLQDFGIEPQLYGLRWIRLLFGREFDMYELLKLWDAIFAQDPTFQIVEYICLVMLLRMRDQLLQKDYAECLSMLMRPSPVSKPATLVEQAKYLQENLTQDGALHILQQMDVRSGKEPRSSLYDGIVLQSHDQTRQQRASHHRRSSGTSGDNGFSRITTNMMKNPQFRDINKAIAGVMETFQNNVNSFGDPSTVGGSRRSTVTSDFPSNIDRVIPKSNVKFESSTASNKTAKNQTSPSKLINMNKQMGELVATCISMLEKEIFPPVPAEGEEPPMTQQEPTVQSKEHTEETKDDDHTPEERGTEENKQVSTDTEDSKGHAGGDRIKDEASVVMALAGLKHVRDVLLGKQPYFDASVMKLNNLTENNEDDWHIVESKEAESAFEEAQKEQATKSKQADKKLEYEKSKPLPPLAKRPSSVFFESKLPQVPVKYVPTNPTPPKPAVKYRIEDLLSDPDLQLHSPKSSTNSKLKWILSEENDSQPNAKTAQETPKMLTRKRSSFIINKAVSATGSTIDPLDAKNVDNRKTYEFDTVSQ
ncbi:RabGAP/TBC [Rhizopus microsporus var. microsporus]|uniref:RabGAP/TBC n=2 Tax=Rhizopus microsporus TaxID=58291 RepID=A0A2G4ST06_RHIZD|nr:RabGAP/TBC [Rhizopus microsporus ATCC 52813]ORE10095.1 RabGAP/TBC [Rhizopus microsporus var. microsporus]PHZ11894.1 RabGAP/TBC [Rhizopus microsporus ATCC 52813]